MAIDVKHEPNLGFYLDKKIKVDVIFFYLNRFTSMTIKMLKKWSTSND